MKLIFKYLKPYFLIVLAIIGLTFVQVQTELSLPDYMSDIVTNGIQYAGIESGSPFVIVREDMDELLLFMDESARDKTMASYRSLPAGSSLTYGGQQIVLNRDAYVLETDEDVNGLLRRPLLYMYQADKDGIDVSGSDISKLKETFDKELAGLEDNYDSIVKIYIRKLYAETGLSSAAIQNSYILKTGLMMLAVAAVGVAVNLISTYLSTRTCANVAAAMRKDIFEKVESFSSSEFSRFSTSSLITRSGNDITKIQQLIQMMLRMMLISPIMGITAVIKVTRYPEISWLLMVAIGIMIGVMIILAVFAIPKFEIYQKLTDRINSVMREFLDGMLVIRAFNSQKKEEEKFDGINSELRMIDRFVSNMMNIIGPVMTLIMNGLTVLIIWFAARQIDIDVMSIGDMMAFSQYAIHVVMSFMFVTMMFFMIPRSMVSVRRVREVLDVENTILDPEIPVDIPEGNGRLSFENVSFRYPGAQEKVLEDISFTADPGETVALIGSTGSGKSTIVKLIPRLFDVSEGKITYNGEDIRNYRQKDLHDKIGYASQRAVLFSGDIRSNIEFGRSISPEDLQKAIRISQSENIVSEKEEGLDYLIAQGGTNVSGGQKQRLSIARALAEDRNIYIFDDCFSALDYETDKKLRAELHKLISKTRATVLIVAQRIATIKNADKIIVLDEGKIVGEGKHQDLLKDCEVYRQIAYSQLSQEELA